MADTTSVLPAELTTLVTTDLIGITRGRSVPTATLDDYWTTGCGWLPIFSALTPQNTAAPNPWGPLGDLRLLPDRNSRVQVKNGPDNTALPLDFIHGDLIETDGTPWDVCPRTLLRQEIERYRDSLGLLVLAAFEHEFTLSGKQSLGDPSPISLHALRDASDFAGWLVGALQAAGVEPETFTSEYGPHQYEITCRPTYGVAVILPTLRERKIPKVKMSTVKMSKLQMSKLQ